MISNSKSFIIQAFVALIILASSMTFPVNAAAIPPTGQFFFQPRRTRRALLTSELGFSREAEVGLRDLLPKRAIADRSGTVPAPVVARKKFNPACLLLLVTCLDETSN